MDNILFRDLGFLDLPAYAGEDGHIYDRDCNVISEHGHRYKDDVYKDVWLCGQHWAVHRLIAWAFPDICGEYHMGDEVDHINRDPSDNRPYNLQWGTHSDNMNNPNTIEYRKRVFSDEEYRKRRSDIAADLWSRPEYRATMNEIRNTPEFKKLHSERVKEGLNSKDSKTQTTEWREHQSEKSKEVWSRPEHRAKMSEIHNSPEFRQKRSEISKQGWNDERKAKQIEEHSKPIVQLTLDGKYVREWKSATEASNQEGYVVSSISACCNGRRKSHKNYRWMRLDEYEKREG